MKELTIEEKAKAYDEALERARIAYKDENRHLKAALERIFPELKESKDERIRKKLIEAVKGDMVVGGTKDKQLAISWLEKQGESTDINPSEFDLRLNKLLKQFETLPKEELVNCLSFYLNVVQNDGTYREEKQGEQKPTDKVEPKFHKGGWVVDNAGYIWKIKGILNKFYILEGVEGDESCPTTEWADDTFHLWTIQDAKDGDVLAYNDGSLTIFHYRLSGLDAGLYMSHVLLIDKIELKQTCAINNVHPATKEQRDQLEKAMADAGYTFDFDKKELKKIEQKPWSEEDENNLYLTTVAIEREYSGELFLDPKKVNEQVGIGRKLINWLRSFENRVGCEVNCTTTKEWSEEDKKKLNRIYMLLAEAADEHAFSTTCRLIGDNECVELQDFLKSIKLQNHWKPSDDQLEALKNAIHIKPFENPSDSLLWGLYEQIKKLKE